MAIHFKKDAWKKIKKDSIAWWEGKLERPLINIRLPGADPGMPRPEGIVSQLRDNIEYFDILKCFSRSYFDFSIPVETILTQWQYVLSCEKYIGDAYPAMTPFLGPFANSLFMGAKEIITPETIWCESSMETPVSEIHFSFNSEEPLFKRIKDIYEAAAQYFDGNICFGMIHLNNGIDSIAPFTSSEAMALAYYDDPDHLKRLIWENHELFFKYFNAYVKAMGHDLPGYTTLCSLFSTTPWSILQSDYSAMIGPKMYEEFILPELAACCRKIENSYYHLDGTGALQHLDMILSIPELKCIQWVPGDGRPDCKHWLDVYKKIRSAGKLIHLYGELDTLEVVAEQLGSANGIYFTSTAIASQEDKVMRLLENFGVTAS